jgi:hypothetical protein
VLLVEYVKPRHFKRAPCWLPLAITVHVGGILLVVCYWLWHACLKLGALVRCRYYAINRHKATTLTPAYHAGAQLCF